MLSTALQTIPHGLGLIDRNLQPRVARVASRFNVSLEMFESPANFVTVVESSWPDLMLIDSDIMGNPCEVCHVVRTRNPLVKVLIVAYFWSEREEALRCCADVILHRPVRNPEWSRAFDMCGIQSVGVQSLAAS